MKEVPEYTQVEVLSCEGYELFIDSSGTKFWYKNGQYHREGGPAIEWADGSKRWFLDGLCHREDGPAFERSLFEKWEKWWYLNDIEVSEEDFNEVWTCPLDRLPLYINTPLAPIAKRRLSGNTQYQKAYFKNLSLKQKIKQKIKYLFKTVLHKSILLA